MRKYIVSLMYLLLIPRVIMTHYIFCYVVRTVVLAERERHELVLCHDMSRDVLVLAQLYIILIDFASIS